MNKMSSSSVFYYIWVLYLKLPDKGGFSTTNGIFYAPIAWLGLCSFYLLFLALDEYAVSKWGANIPPNRYRQWWKIGAEEIKSLADSNGEF